MEFWCRHLPLLQVIIALSRPSQIQLQLCLQNCSDGLITYGLKAK